MIYLSDFKNTIHRYREQKTILQIFNLKVGKLPRNNVIDPPRGNVLKYCSDFKTKVCNKVDFSGFSTTAGRFGTGFFFPSAFRIGRRSWDLEFIVLSENFVAEHFTDNSEHFGSVNDFFVVKILLFVLFPVFFLSYGII